MDDSRLVFGFIGIVIGIVVNLTIDALLHHIDIVYSCRGKWESLKAKLENLENAIFNRHHSLELKISQRISTELAVTEWVKKLKELHGEASELVDNCRIPRFDLISRYQTSVKVTKKHAAIDKHLKCVPLIELELLIWLLVQIESRHEQLIEILETSLTRSDDLIMEGTGVVEAAIVQLVINAVTDKVKDVANNLIFHYIKIMFRFKKELASLTDEVMRIRPIFSQIEEKCKSLHTVSKAVDVWLKESQRIVKHADELKHDVPWWDVISRYKASKRIAKLIADIDAHVKLVSVIHVETILEQTNSLEALFQWLERFAQDLHNIPRPTTSQQIDPPPEDLFFIL